MSVNQELCRIKFKQFHIMETIDTTFKYEIYYRENKKWLESIAFYQHELDYFKGLLKDLMSKNTESVFQNQAKIVRNHLQDWAVKFDIILQEITREQWGYEDDAEGKDFLLGEEIYNRHIDIRIKYHDAEKGFVEIKHNFYDFVSKYI